jgi:hypothetical protein
MRSRLKFEALEKRKITWMLPGWLLGSIEDGGVEAVAISLAELRKGMAKFSLLRAPLDT